MGAGEHDTEPRASLVPNTCLHSSSVTPAVNLKKKKKKEEDFIRKNKMSVLMIYM